MSLAEAVSKTVSPFLSLLLKIIFHLVPPTSQGAVLQWMQENGLRLNLDKTEVLRVDTLGVGGLGGSLTLGGVTLAAKSGVCSLGVHLDPTLTMETPVSYTHLTLPTKA